MLVEIALESTILLGIAMTAAILLKRSIATLEGPVLWLGP